MITASGEWHPPVASEFSNPVAEEAEMSPPMSMSDELQAYFDATPRAWAMLLEELEKMPQRREMLRRHKDTLSHLDANKGLVGIPELIITPSRVHAAGIKRTLTKNLQEQHAAVSPKCVMCATRARPCSRRLMRYVDAIDCMQRHFLTILLVEPGKRPRVI
jgi:hypothetical protein